ncbi:hypothetical protein PR048_027667 [Dryococelus australis]|uniref:Uncharacterized protein n=1 Tax=Dryococelus australis TaxID=614101 RepID=A0ABQ9GH34_9NEOP|nr:hypothetical protein PR048_027667 [Dryococelus australis]
MPRRLIRQAFAQLDEFEIDRIVGLREAGWSFCLLCESVLDAVGTGEYTQPSGRHWWTTRTENRFIVQQAVSISNDIAANYPKTCDGNCGNSRGYQHYTQAGSRAGSAVAASIATRPPSSSEETSWPASRSMDTGPRRRGVMVSGAIPCDHRTLLVVNTDGAAYSLTTTFAARPHTARVSLACLRDVHVIRGHHFSPIENVLEQIGWTSTLTSVDYDLFGGSAVPAVEQSRNLPQYGHVVSVPAALCLYTQKTLNFPHKQHSNGFRDTILPTNAKTLVLAVSKTFRLMFAIRVLKTANRARFEVLFLLQRKQIDNVKSQTNRNILSIKLAPLRRHSSRDVVLHRKEYLRTAIQLSRCFAELSFGETVIWEKSPCGTGMKGRGKREIPENIRRQTASSGAVPTCGNPVTQPEIERGPPWWEASEHSWKCLQDIHGDSSPFLLLPFHELSNGFWPRLTSSHPAIQFVPKKFYRVEVGALGGPVQSANIVVGASVFMLPWTNTSGPTPKSVKHTSTDVLNYLSSRVPKYCLLDWKAEGSLLVSSSSACRMGAARELNVFECSAFIGYHICQQSIRDISALIRFPKLIIGDVVGYQALRKVVWCDTIIYEFRSASDCASGIVIVRQELRQMGFKSQVPADYLHISSVNAYGSMKSSATGMSTTSDGRIWVWQMPGKRFMRDCVVSVVKYEGEWAIMEMTWYSRNTMGHAKGGSLEEHLDWLSVVNDRGLEDQFDDEEITSVCFSMTILSAIAHALFCSQMTQWMCSRTGSLPNRIEAEDIAMKVTYPTLAGRQAARGWNSRHAGGRAERAVITAAERTWEVALHPPSHTLSRSPASPFKCRYSPARRISVLTSPPPSPGTTSNWPCIDPPCGVAEARSRPHSYGPLHSPLVVYLAAIQTRPQSSITVRLSVSSTVRSLETEKDAGRRNSGDETCHSLKMVPEISNSPPEMFQGRHLENMHSHITVENSKRLNDSYPYEVLQKMAAMNGHSHSLFCVSGDDVETVSGMFATRLHLTSGSEDIDIATLVSNQTNYFKKREESLLQISFIVALSCTLQRDVKGLDVLGRVHTCGHIPRRTAAAPQVRVHALVHISQARGTLLRGRVDIVRTSAPGRIGREAKGTLVCLLLLYPMETNARSTDLLDTGLIPPALNVAELQKRSDNNYAVATDELRRNVFANFYMHPHCLILDLLVTNKYVRMSQKNGADGLQENASAQNHLQQLLKTLGLGFTTKEQCEAVSNSPTTTANTNLASFHEGDARNSQSLLTHSAEMFRRNSGSLQEVGRYSPPSIH